VSLARLNDWLGMHQHVVSLAGDVVGVIGLLIALASLMYTISNNTKAQNFGSMLAIQNLIRDEKEKYYGVARVQPRDQHDYELAATHYFNTLELTAFLLNRKLIHGNAMMYLSEWIRDEIDHIYQSPTQGAVMHSLMQEEDPPFSEIFRFHPPTGPFPVSPAEPD